MKLFLVVFSLLLLTCGCSSERAPVYNIPLNSSSSAPESGALDEFVPPPNQEGSFPYDFYPPPKEFIDAISSIDGAALERQAFHSDLLQAGDCLIYFEKDQHPKEIFYYLLDGSGHGTLLTTTENLWEVQLYDEKSLLLKVKAKDGYIDYFCVNIVSGKLTQLPSHDMYSLYRYGREIYGVKAAFGPPSPCPPYDIYLIRPDKAPQELVNKVTNFCFSNHMLYYIQEQELPDAQHSQSLFAMDLKSQESRGLYELEDHISYLSIRDSDLAYITSDNRTLKLIDLASGTVQKVLPLNDIYFESPHNPLSSYEAGVVVFDDASDLAFPGSFLGYIDYATGSFRRISDVTVANFCVIGKSIYYLRFDYDDPERQLHLFRENLSGKQEAILLE